jgi:hypothetical protein
MTKVAVLGCGPTGLVAAHAAVVAGAEVTIYSKRGKSHMFGAQYLHEPIPFIEAGDPVTLDYQLRGTLDGYRDKVYGPGSDVQVSPEDYAGEHQAHDIRRTYDKLWDLYSDQVEESNITPGWLAGVLPDNFDHVINTIPLPQLCVKGHSFTGQNVWVMGDSDRQVVPVLVAANTVVCNGEPEPSWYRASNIFGFKTVEWPSHGRKPPLPVAQVTKPLDNTCTCWPKITRLGRFGMWRKGILVHHGFQMALDLVIGNLGPEETRHHYHPCPLSDKALSWFVASQLGCRCG